jgi:hypothetical protein
MSDPDPPAPSDPPRPEAAPPPGALEGTEQAPKSFLRGLGLAEKAKGAMGAAAGGAAALKGKASSALSSLSEQASSRAQEMLGAGLDQVKGVAADLNAALPIVKLAGYSLQGVTLSASLTPSVVAAFHVDNAITDEHATAIETEHADNKLAVMIIRTLRRASKLQESIAFGSLKPKELSIAIGLSPSVSLRFG